MHSLNSTGSRAAARGPVQAHNTKGHSCLHVLASATPRDKGSSSSSSKTAKQRMEERWWDGGNEGGGRRQAARAGDWEEERNGGGVSNWRGDEFGAVVERRESSRSADRVRVPRGQQQQWEQQQGSTEEGDGPGTYSHVNKVWHSNKWRPARGRQSLYEETDADSDTDDLFDSDKPFQPWSGRQGGSSREWDRGGSGYNSRDRGANGMRSSGGRNGGRDGMRGSNNNGGRAGGRGSAGGSRVGNGADRSYARGGQQQQRTLDEADDYAGADDDVGEGEEGYGEEEGSGWDNNRQQQQRGGRGSVKGAGMQQGGSGRREEWDEQQEGSRDLSRAVLVGEALYGVHPILNALLQGRRKPFMLYVLAGMDLSKRKDARSVRQTLSLAQQQGVAVSRISRHELNTLSGGKVHQGLVLDCSPLSFTPLDKLPPASEIMQGAAAAGVPCPVWVALDEVLDPQNFGAILRSGWCLGAAGMLVSAKNCAPLSPAVSKASAGAMEAAEVHAAKMLRDTLVAAAESGWLVLGAAGDASAQSCQDVAVDRPTIVVLGNEGRGLRTNIRRVCTGFVRVDMGRTGQGFTGLGSGSTPSVGTQNGSTTSSSTSNGIPESRDDCDCAVPSSASGAEVGDGASYWGGHDEEGEVREAGSMQDFDGLVMAERRGASRSAGLLAAGVDSLNVSVATGILLHSLTASAARHVGK